MNMRVFFTALGVAIICAGGLVAPKVLGEDQSPTSPYTFQYVDNISGTYLHDIADERSGCHYLLITRYNGGTAITPVLTEYGVPKCRKTQ